MKRKLLSLLLLSVAGVSAWADNTVRYSTDGGTTWTEAENLNTLTASEGAITSASTDVQIQLLADQSLNNRIAWKTSNTLTITATKAVTITRGTLSRTTAWLINTSSGTVNIGSSGDNIITFKGGGHADNNRIFKNILGNESTGKMNVTNCEFKDFKFDTENTNLGYLWLNKNANGRTVFKDITVDNCVTTEEAFIKSISPNNDNIFLQGNINFNNCTGTHFYISARIRLGEVEGTSSTSITALTPITINWASSTTAIGTAVVVKAQSAMASKFFLTNDALGLYGNNNDLKLTQAYTLPVSSYGASTLVLPFASTIPTGVTCYTLNYTAGNNSVKATEVNTTLAANTPVLVNANEGSYKFVSTAISGDAATGSAPVTVGALTGVYTETTVPSGSYILWANESNPIGFYLANNNTVAANRAYLTADGAGANMLNIVFGEETGISTVTAQQNDGNIYNLQGRSISQPTKGIYVKNGKKFLVK